jgi:hypothetical protein
VRRERGKVRGRRERGKVLCQREAKCCLILESTESNMAGEKRDCW